MNNTFDELAKGLAQSTSRRMALKKFSVGLVGIALTSLGLASKAEADPKRKPCLQAGAICGPKASFCNHACCSGQFYGGGNGTFICL